ncbi:hypothetical protein [Nocardiopsis tropica]|uniref:Uncharacterized protein n=1 Tax=Nocardiopsis tropica TaxID=109330 RepID=A0ABU7KK57_9ACTN|nr:hypothetical protein [Nocardiopsis umidischolae]MEE2049507.1 hypothetical protein [Nocardiopsis umidischolae]
MEDDSDGPARRGTMFSGFGPIAWMCCRYVIWRIGRLWVATDVDPLTETAPTIIEDTLTRFVTELENPGLRAGGPFGRPTE